MSPGAAFYAAAVTTVEDLIQLLSDVNTEFGELAIQVLFLA